jgi:hypothetical protein
VHDSWGNKKMYRDMCKIVLDNSGP